MVMTRREFIQAISLEYQAEARNELVWLIIAERKSAYIQVLDEYVTIMLNNFKNIKNSYTCSIEVKDGKGNIDFDTAFTKLESMINE